MISTSTLTSLAMLKVNIDHGQDYLDYLRPFIIQVLLDEKPIFITDDVVKAGILKQFGLEIPLKTVQVVLKRLVKSRLLKKKHQRYHIADSLSDPGITSRKVIAERHINSVMSGLIKFSKTTIKHLSHANEASIALSAFLAEFDISCLRAYLRGTSIPDTTDDHRLDIALIRNYVMHLQQTDPSRFESFMIMVQGHMLANALLCPDINAVSNNYNSTTFYLDTPLLVQRLGAEGSVRKVAIKELISLLKKLGGRVATFSHSRQELESVLIGAADFIDRPNGRGAIVVAARRHGTTKSDLLLLVEQIDSKLGEAGIEIQRTPKHIEQFQIDETIFEQTLGDEVLYKNPRAKEYDINSVRSIYVLRGKKPSLSLEKCRAILVTSNSAFSRAAWNYGKEYEFSYEVSSVITDFVLANISWLKAPMGEPSLPKTEVLAFSYAALQPTQGLLDKFLLEIDKLEVKGDISERDHQLLRSSSHVNKELMDSTLGDETALTKETITDILHRVSTEIKKEESEETNIAMEKYKKTVQELNSRIEQENELKKRLYWQCQNSANFLAKLVFAVIVIILIIHAISSFIFQFINPIFSLTLSLITGVILLLTTVNLVYGHTVQCIHQRISKWIRTKCLARKAEVLGFAIDKFDNKE